MAKRGTAKRRTASEHRATIGLEIHVQLRTAAKLFCRCPHRFGAPPNTLVCETCLGYPGALPVLEIAAVDQALRLALALDADIAPRSAFDRKSYFYADLPKGYQITQQRHPLATGGRIPYDDPETGRATVVRLRRLHLEEDAGKSIHADEETLVDFNRAGAPLVEVVTEPEIDSAAAARAALESLHQVLLYTETSDARMAEGSLRCDVNVSLGSDEGSLGSRVEVKNLNSFRHVVRAIEHEVERQGALLDAGEVVAEETRSFDESTGETRALRGKESDRDYRFHPEPDLPPLVIGASRLDRVAAELPELPWARRERFVASRGLDADAARRLARTRELADYFEAVARAMGSRAADDPTEAARWILNVVLGEQSERGAADEDLARALTPERLAALARATQEGALSSTAARKVLSAMWGEDRAPLEVARDLDLLQVRDDAVLRAWARAALAEHPEEARAFRDGEAKLLGFFVGRAMARSGGRADPRRLREILEGEILESVP